MWYVDPTVHSEFCHSFLYFALVLAQENLCKALEIEGILKHENCHKNHLYMIEQSEEREEKTRHFIEQVPS